MLETDIWNGKPLPYEVQSTYHWSAATCFSDHSKGEVFPYCPSCNFSDAFHTWTVDMTPRALIFSVDGTAFEAVTQVDTQDTLPQTPMYLIFGNQLWQHWNYPEELPSVFQIDHVTAWELQE
jgi:beta-glucanase (GH16 family)